MSRRILKVLFLLCAISLSFAVQTASASEVSHIDVRVFLNDDGSARIEQVWEVDVYGKGSEFYIPQTRLGDMEIKDFSVSDNSGKDYINEGLGWDSKRSVQEKAGRCGVVKTGEGFELCWGRGSDGKRTFKVSWTFTNFIKAYDDYDGFIVRLVNDKMSPMPKSVMITLEKPGCPFSKGEVQMWAFGFKGTILPEDGKIVVKTDENTNLGESNYVNVMLRFAKGIFKPESIVSGSFKEVEDLAMQGAIAEEKKEAKEEESDPLTMLFLIILSGVMLFAPLNYLTLLALPTVMIFGMLCIPIAFLRSRVYGDTMNTFFYQMDALYYNLSSRIRRQLRKAPWAREIPFEGKLSAIYWVILATPLALRIKKTALIEAYFLRFLKLGLLRAEISEQSKVNLVVNQEDKKAVNAEGLTEDELRLFGVIKTVAGENGILEGEEFLKWSQESENRKIMYSWLKDTEKAGKELFNELNTGSVHGTSGAKKGIIARILDHLTDRVKFFLFAKNKNDFKEDGMLTDSGIKKIFEVYGFRKYLLDFTLINERRAVEVELWDEYLVLASLFGIADKVHKELASLNADLTGRSELVSSYESYDGFSCLADITSTLVSASKPEKTGGGGDYDSSSGGSSYESGGGGYSGGGSGGGER